MRQTNEIVELTCLQKKIAQQLRKSDSLNYVKTNDISVPVLPELQEFPADK